MGPRSELECRERAYAQKYNCNVISVNEVISRKLCYKLAVIMWGDHKSKNGIKKYGINFIAEKILLIASIFDNTYGIEYFKKFPYDYIVCCGEFHKKIFEQFFDNEKIFMLGSPRIKSNLVKTSKTEAAEAVHKIIIEQTGININFTKKTILLLPSYNNFVSSIRGCATINFLPVLSKLSNEYNIIIKPHPEWASSWDGCKNFFCRALPNAIFLNNVDNFILYPIVDFVICDYSNVILTTISADKNIILFNASRDDVEKNYDLRDPVNSYLRDRVINFYPDEEEKFFAALKNDDIWEKQKEIRRQIRAEFFTENPNPARDIADLCWRIVRGEV
jgi:CDP-glycerol glycerophosphotransferase (TagB/SpsB family)